MSMHLRGETTHKITRAKPQIACDAMMPSLDRHDFYDIFNIFCGSDMTSKAMLDTVRHDSIVSHFQLFMIYLALQEFQQNQHFINIVNSFMIKIKNTSTPLICSRTLPQGCLVAGSINQNVTSCSWYPPNDIPLTEFDHFSCQFPRLKTPLSLYLLLFVHHFGCQPSVPSNLSRY